MKYFLFLGFFFSNFSIGSTQFSKIVLCLANEEQQIHENKIQGPIYRVNQRILNYLVEQNFTNFSNELENSICSSNSPSSEFILSVLINQNNLFIPIDKNSNEAEVQKFSQQVKSIIDDVYEIFLFYIAESQKYLNSPHCLTKLFHGYESFLEKEKYLKELESQHSNTESLILIKNIIFALSNIDLLAKRCKKIAN